MVGEYLVVLHDLEPLEKRLTFFFPGSKCLVLSVVGIVCDSWVLGGRTSGLDRLELVDAITCMVPLLASVSN